MNLPAWLEDLTEEFGEARLAGDKTRAEAVTALRDKILAEDDQPLLLGIVADFAARALDSWHRSHLNPGGSRGAAAELQSELFPQLPVRLYVRPAVTKPLILCTAHDWDMARNVLRGRTVGAREAADNDWAHFEAAYARVRPLLTGDATTAEVAEQLRQPA
jgi:hypothetical protein